MKTSEFLALVADGLLLFEMTGRYRYAYMGGGMGGVRRMVAAEDRRELNRKYDALRRKGLISARRIGTRLSLSLTDKGQENLERLLMRSSKARRDGRYVYVMYDIPERWRTVRDRLRWLMKSVGFKQYQRSVWRTRRDVGLVFRSWIKRHKADAWIDVYEA